jgi:YVTN family beta-propeller protein
LPTPRRRFERFAALAFALAALTAGAQTPPRRSGLLALTTDGGRLVVVNPDSQSISVVDLAARRTAAEIAVGGTPQSVAIAPDDSRAFVPTREGFVAVIDLAAKRKTAAVVVGPELFGAVADSARVYVTVSGGSRVAVIDAGTLKITGSIATEEAPRGIALNGGKLLVTHFRSGRLSVIDAATSTVERVIPTLPDSNLSQGIFVNGNRVYLPQTRSANFNPALLFDSTIFPMVSVVDLAGGRDLFSERLVIDLFDTPVNMPFDAVVTTGGKLYEVNAGSDDISVFRVPSAVFPPPRALAHIAVGLNPRGIALSPDERLAYVDNTLGGTVSLIDTASDKVVEEIVVTTIPLPRDVLNGKRLFHTTTLSTMAKERWISCASCHFDGGADGRTWFFPDGPRNTTSLFGVADTLPMHWSGDLDELQDVENTIRVIQAGTGLAAGASNCDPACDQGPANAGRSRDLDDLAAYMRSLRPPPPAGGVDASAAQRGEALFNDRRTACASCHPAPLFTDRAKHDVGTGRGTINERKGTSFDTPSLRGIHSTAPYFHDGSKATLEDVVNAAAGQHGDTRMLTAAERRDLADYLRTIDFGTPRRRAARK